MIGATASSTSEGAMLRGSFGYRLALTALALVTASPFPGVARQPRPVPDRLMILVFDQMRPDYIDRFDLQHFKKFRAASRHFPNAYVGHLGSQTVVSHLVIPTGLLPRQLPWQDNVFVDRAGTLGKAGAVYDTGRLTREQYWTLLAALPDRAFLASRLRQQTGRKVIAIGEKDYATLLLGTPAADAIITLAKAGGACQPSGMRVPAYISANPRFTLDCSNPYGTGLSTVYALDGDHYVPGENPAHQGGDVWTTDAALEVMAREDWSGLFLTFGAVDKVGHMLGEHDGEGLTSVSSPYRLRDVARIADAQLGRLIAGLEKRALLDRTLIVLTADHGGQRNDVYMGNNRYQSCCGFENNAAAIDPPYWIEHLKQLGKLHTTYQDTSVKVWLADTSPENERSILAGLADIPGMAEVFALRRVRGHWRYDGVLSRLSSQRVAFRTWAKAHHQELVNTMAAEGAPHLVGLLADGHGFGRIGDHGGAQERVQRIPLMIRIPGEQGSVRKEPMRLVDINGAVSRLMNLR